jgi:hypothetical protein
MLTFVEELELTAQRERHLLCLAGWCLSLAAVLFLVAVGVCYGRQWVFTFALLEAVVGVLFFHRARRALRRIRHLEQFAE